MNRKSKTHLQLILFLAFFFLFAYSMLSNNISLIKIPKLEYIEYVNDMADILSEQEEIWLMEYANQYYEETGISIFIFTIPSTNKQSISLMAEKMMKDYSIPESGLIILYNKEKNDICMRMGKTVSNYVSNNSTPYYLRQYFSKYQMEKKYYLGFYYLQQGILYEIVSRM